MYTTRLAYNDIKLGDGRAEKKGSRMANKGLGTEWSRLGSVGGTNRLSGISRMGFAE